ncbi:replication initiation protein [Paraburkholderia fungorum]|uniref:replication initiation protein n=1 Tax=Paraburkholderia fungorum TaxID=134537 RepID=UPI0038BACF5A
MASKSVTLAEQSPQPPKRLKGKKGAKTEARTTQIGLFTVEEPEPFKKATPAVHISAKNKALTLVQHKIYNALLANAIEQDRDNAGTNVGLSQFSIALTDLVDKVGLNSNNRDYLKGVINSLIGTVVNWDFLEAERGEVWAATGLLSTAEMDRSTLTYEFSAKIRDFLVHPQMYATIDMRIVRAFKRAAALVLWENSVRYEGIGQSAVIPIEKLRQLFLGQEGAKTIYPEYKEFKRNVLTPAVREANEVSDHTIEVLEVRQGRAVVGVRFTVARKQEAARLESVDSDLLMSVTQLGIPSSEARKTLGRHSESDVRNALDYVRAREAKKGATPITNVPAYFRKALAEKWVTPEKSSGIKKAAAAPGLSITGITEEEIREKYRASQLGDARAYFDELSAADQAELIARYNAWQPMQKWRLEGGKKQSTAAQQSFLSWLAHETWGEPSTEDLFKFVIKGLASTATA